MPLSYVGNFQHALNKHIFWSLAREGLELATNIYWDLCDSKMTSPPLG